MIAVPFVLIALLQGSPQWYPILDQAMIELLVRDVGGDDSPTTGLVGRFVVEEMQASHPGPLSWYLLWPAYKLLGGSSWALLASNVLLGLAAAWTSILMVARRSRPTQLLVVAAVLVLLARAYGLVILGEVWNPHLPVLWWLVTMLAAWSVLVGDRPMVLVLVFAGSLCAQTHISYGIPVTAMLLLAGGALVLDAVRRPARRWRDAGWMGAGLVALISLWAPAIFDQLTHDPGNLWLLWRYFTGDADAPIGWGEGLEVVLIHMDPVRLVTGELWGDRQTALPAYPSGPVVPGVVLLAAWSAVLALTWRAADSQLRRLHVVVGVVLVVSLVAASRIVPPVWYWVVLFLWGVQAMVLVAIGLSVAAVLERRPRPRSSRVGRAATRAGALAATTLLAAILVGETIVGPRLADHSQSRLLAELVPETVEALRSGEMPGGGADGPYRVVWRDPVALGSGGFGLVDELERAGFDARADDDFSPQVRPHRIVEETDEDTTTTIEMAAGHNIERVLALPGAVQVAYADLRSAADLERREQLRSELIRRLAPNVERLRAIDENPIALAFAENLDPDTARMLVELAEIGLPMAIIVVPAAPATVPP
ncbi:hypothetical protein BH18ACT2_BH18ACT2_01820 [soil metagenome]